MRWGTAPGAPYAEQADRDEVWLDGILLGAWGRVSPYLLSTFDQGRLARLVHRIEKEEKDVAALTDQRLREAADQLRARFAVARKDNAEVARAFALAREAARRHRGLRHFPVQLLGGAVMMSGALAEMETGEGKTMTALLPAVAASLMGRAVHIITVNDYLARRDAEELAAAYGALGLTVGLIQQGQSPHDRQRAYACDVTYCTNKEVVFDYLRDRLAFGSRRGQSHLLLEQLFKTGSAGTSAGLVLRGLDFAIVDEADSVLIDEARTPLILSGHGGEAESDVGCYATALDMSRNLAQGDDFHLEASDKSIRLTEQGTRRITNLSAGLPGLWRMRRAREEIMRQALSACHLFERDVHYIVSGSKVQIVDEYTGRVMPDRSWEHGMHQLIEAKEGCPITERHQTLARITYQQFFRRYHHLCGMTGTALEAAGELRAVYGLRVVRIPTNRQLCRKDAGTQLHRNRALKCAAVLTSARSVLSQGRPVLIGTRSVDASEYLSAVLRKAGLAPVVLNARQDRDEADIIAGAGLAGRVTVATNMAGRGTDIKLLPAVREAGGLHVILTEYHESRRIDRQLFGRSGRQGDPGSYESIVALDDELFRRFVSKPLLAAVAAVASRSEMPGIVGRILKGLGQSGAERVHARARRMALREGTRFAKALAFAGRE